MADFEKLIVHIGPLAEGRWLAATATAPYFCFEAASEKEVKQVVRRALRFFDQTLAKHNGSLPNPEFHVKERVSFAPTERVSAKELLAA
jgi:predicted RNase H-like HicB family nuclease